MCYVLVSSSLTCPPPSLQELLVLDFGFCPRFTTTSAPLAFQNLLLAQQCSQVVQLQLSSALPLNILLSALLFSVQTSNTTGEAAPLPNAENVTVLVQQPELLSLLYMALAVNAAPFFTPMQPFISAFSTLISPALAADVNDPDSVTFSSLSTDYSTWQEVTVTSNSGVLPGTFTGSAADIGAQLCSSGELQAGLPVLTDLPLIIATDSAQLAAQLADHAGNSSQLPAIPLAVFVLQTIGVDIMEGAGTPPPDPGQGSGGDGVGGGTCANPPCSSSPKGKHSPPKPQPPNSRRQALAQPVVASTGIEGRAGGAGAPLPRHASGSRGIAALLRGKPGTWGGQGQAGSGEARHLSQGGAQAASQAPTTLLAKDVWIIGAAGAVSVPNSTSITPSLQLDNNVLELAPGVQLLIQDLTLNLLRYTSTKTIQVLGIPFANFNRLAGWPGCGGIKQLRWMIT